MKKIIFKIYIMLEVVIQKGNSFSIQEYPAYPFMDEYYLKTISLGHVAATCQNFICEKSGLIVTQIELLVNSFNYKMDLLAENENIANVYQLHWNKQLADLAKNQSLKCLPPTYQNSIKKFKMYDEKSALAFGFPPGVDVRLEVVIAERNISYSNTEGMYRNEFTSNMIEYYTNVFFSDDTISSRALDTEMGCGYIYMETDSSVRDRLLCIFGFQYPKNPKFSVLKGRPCSECDVVMGSDSMNGTNSSRTGTWRCDPVFRNLCDDLSRIHQTFEGGMFKYPCNNQWKENIEISTVVPIIETTRKISTDAAITEWPCLPILIPLVILIVIFLILATYHFATALKFNFDNNY